MAVITGTETKGEAYERVVLAAARMKQIATDNKALMEASSFSGDHVVRLRDDLINIQAEITTASTVTGLAAYAQEVEDNDQYDAITEYAALKTAAASAQALIETITPDGSGYLELWEFATGSGVVPRVFAATVFANGNGLLLKNALDTIIAAVD